MGIWQKRNGWLIPKLSPSDDGPYSEERLNEFRLAGTFTAIFLLVMRQPPPMLSPHITMFLLCGSCPPDYEYLQMCEPEAAKVLAPWFDFVRSGINDASSSIFTPGTFRQGDVHHLLAEYLDEQVRVLDSPLKTMHSSLYQVSTFSDDSTMRSQGTVALWNTYLFGRRSFRSHGEWQAFTGAFNMNGAKVQVCRPYTCSCSSLIIFSVWICKWHRKLCAYSTIGASVAPNKLST
jgi:hypothetical protein